MRCKRMFRCTAAKPLTVVASRVLDGGAELRKASFLSCEVYKRPSELGSRYRVLQEPCGRVAAIVSREEGGRLVVAFSGCRSIDDVLRCVDGSFVAPRLGMRINAAIWTRYSDLRPKLLNLLNGVWDPYCAPPPLFTGHSLGGALAQLAAHMLPEHVDGEGPGGESISFGAPYVGDAGYAAMLNDAMHTRVVIEHDVVPRLTVNSEQVHAGRVVVLPDVDPSSAPFPLNMVHNHASRKYYRMINAVDQ